MNSTVSILIPVFNQLSYTKQCIDSILQHKGSESFEIIIADNGSSDGTAEYLGQLKTQYPFVSTLRLERNYGYSVANNRAATLAKGTHLLFLNNDTIVTANWISALLSASQKSKVGIVGAKLIYPKWELINHAGYVYNSERRKFYLIYELQSPQHPAVNKEREFQAVIGACLLMKKDLFLRVGMFSDIGLEDIDLCLKVREQGMRVIYCPQCEVYHYGTVTISNSPSGSIPKNSTAEFNNRWPMEKLIGDDERFYAEDGFEVIGEKDGHFVLKDNSTPSLDLYVKGNQALNSGNLEIAKSQFKRALEIFPRNELALAGMVALYVKQGDWTSALQANRTLIERCPLSYTGYVTIVKMLTLNGMLEEADRYLTQFRALPDIPEECLQQIAKFV